MLKFRGAFPSRPLYAILAWGIRASVTEGLPLFCARSPRCTGILATGVALRSVFY